MSNKSSQKLTNYHDYGVPDLQQLYVQMLNDNLTHLISYLYPKDNTLGSVTVPTMTTVVRVALSMQMLIASQKLIPCELSSKIAKDISELAKDIGYLKRWKDPKLRRQCLRDDLALLRKHTEIDDTISLNHSATNATEDSELAGLSDITAMSTISTLNVNPHTDDASDHGVGDDTHDERCTVM
jgi:hypothetical protein